MTQTATSNPEDGTTIPRDVTRWVSITEIAAHLGLSIRTVHRYVKTEGLPVHRPRVGAGRGVPLMFDVEEVDAWLRNRCSRRIAGQTPCDIPTADLQAFAEAYGRFEVDIPLVRATELLDELARRDRQVA